MSTEFRDRLKMLGDRADELARYQAQAEQNAEDTKAAKHKAVESQSIVTLCAEVARLHREIARVEAEAKRTVDLTTDAVGKSVCRILDKLDNKIDDLGRSVRRDLYNEMAKELAVLRAEVHVALGTKPRSAGFKFAGETADDSDEALDLPDLVGSRDLH